MKAFVRETGIAVPLDAANVDTDQIIPKQFLKSVTKIGFGKHLFHDWRYLDDAARSSYLRARTSATAPHASTLPGLLPTTDSGQSSPRASRTSSTTTHSTTDSYA